jgi:serine/threonine-protein kinase
MHPTVSMPSRTLVRFHSRQKTILPGSAAIRKQLEKILSSTLFSRSARLTRFISFAAGHALGGTGEPLKEYAVGIEVFDRPSSYDPRIDPIVRVEARRLRSKLSAYYASVGREDTVLVEFPKGTYAPVFRVRTSPPRMLRVVTDSSPLAMTVLPFASLAREGLDNAFAALLTEEVIHALANVRNVLLVPWDIAERSTVSPGQRIDAQIRGSIRYELKRVRVISQFIDAVSRTYLWSEAYDFRGANDRSVRHVARAIAARVEITLPPSRVGSSKEDHLR